MIGIGIANSLGVNLSGLSPAAKSFVTAAGISDPTKVKAINDLVVGLQSSGLWSKMKAVYPFVTDNRNLFSYTENLNNSSWNKSGATVIANNAIAPDGSNTAWRITRINSAAQGFTIRQDVPVVSSTQYTFSVYLKAPNTSTTIQVDLGDGTATPTVTLTTDWQLYTFVKTLGLSGAFFDFNITSGDGSYCWFWHPQLELGSTATTYQPIATTQQAFISNQFKYNLKDPRDTDAAFRLVFNGGWSFSSTGATPNGVNGYADTRLIPSSVLSLNSTHISTYLRTNVSALQCDISVIQDGVSGVNDQLNIYPRYLDEAYFRVYDDSTATVTNTNSQGLFIANRVNSTQTRNFKNSTLNVKTVASGVISTSRIILSAGCNNTGIPTSFSTRQTAFATIGDGLTDDDATNLYYYTQVFQTTLGRQVGSPAYALPTTYDASAKLYLSAIGSTTDSTLNNAVDTFIKGLKADGIYSKMKAVYPFATDNRNLLGYTEDFNNNYWVKNNAIVTTNTTTAPNGTLTADTLSDNLVNNFHYINTGSSIGNNGNNTLSIYAKANTLNYLYLYFYNGTEPGGATAWFNLSSGTIGTVQSGLTASIENAGNGWYRCSITRNFNFTANNSNCGFGVSNADNVGSYLGTNKSLFVWGAQLDAAATATTYQPILTTQQAYISSQFKYNMVNPQDDDSAFRLVFNGGWTHSANGATPNGTNGYADTKLVPSSVLTNNNYHLSHYSRTQSLTTAIEIGADQVTANKLLALDQYYNSLSIKAFAAGGYPSYTVTINNTDTLGFILGSRTSSTSAKMFMDGIYIAQNTTTNLGTLPSINLYLSAVNTSSNVAYDYSNKQTAFASIGDGLTDTEAANLYSRVQALQTALNRQV